MLRRILLEQGSDIAAGSLLLPVGVDREVPTRDREAVEKPGIMIILPREDAEARRIIPVSDEVWIQHRFVMRTVAGEGPAERPGMRDMPEHRFRISGEDIDNQSVCWSEIYELDGQRWGITWEYTLTPQMTWEDQPAVQIKLLQPVENIRPDDGRTWDGHCEFGCVYHIRSPVEDIGCPLEIPELV